MDIPPASSAEAQTSTCLPGWVGSSQQQAAQPGEEDYGMGNLTLGSLIALKSEDGAPPGWPSNNPSSGGRHSNQRSTKKGRYGAAGRERSAHEEAEWLEQQVEECRWV
jgi:hypothetical protein